MTITYCSLLTVRAVKFIAETKTPRYGKNDPFPGQFYEFDGNIKSIQGLIRMHDFADGKGWYSGCHTWAGPLAWSREGFRLNMDYLHDCRLIDKDLYATELAKHPAPLALHHAFKAAQRDLIPTHPLERKYRYTLSLLIESLLAYPLKLNKKGNYGHARSNKSQKIILHNTPDGIRYEGALAISQGELDISYLAECNLVDRADYDIAAISGNYVEALIYALRKKHTNEDVQLSKVAIAPIENVDSNLFGE